VTCKAAAQQFADQFRLKNALTAEEKNFYDLTAPWIVRLLRSIDDKLARVLEVLQNGKH